MWEGRHREMSPYPDYKGQASPATIATGGPMGCGSRTCARATPLATRYITHSKFNRADSLDAAETLARRPEAPAVGDGGAEMVDPGWTVLLVPRG